MATISISIDIPDAALPRVLAGLRAHFGQVETFTGSGVLRDLTQAEVVAKLKQLLIDSIRNMVVNQEVYAATQQVKTSYETVTIS